MTDGVKKMKNNAIISLRTLQEIEGEDKPNTIELKTKGRFAEKNGKYYVIYENFSVFCLHARNK